MRLLDLNPRWMLCGEAGIFNSDNTPAPRREGIGISFDCPCVTCTAGRAQNPEQGYLYTHLVFFKNPLDGGPPFDGAGTSSTRPGWERTGDTFDTLVTRPSILSDLSKGGCGWHGYIGGLSGNQPGEVVSC